jgi:hypothetical protein
MRRRRCVKRYATAKNGSRFGNPFAVLGGRKQRAKQSLARNRQKVDNRVHNMVRETNTKADKPATAEC